MRESDNPFPSYVELSDKQLVAIKKLSPEERLEIFLDHNRRVAEDLARLDTVLPEHMLPLYLPPTQ